MNDVLASAVGLVTGGKAPARLAQTALAGNIATAMSEASVHIGQAPTGSGKSFAYLSVAAERAADAHERTLVSTATLSLQSQLLVKDGPVIAAATKAVKAHDLSVTVLKGWSNYGCVLAASTIASGAAAPELPGMGKLAAQKPQSGRRMNLAEAAGVAASAAAESPEDIELNLAAWVLGAAMTGGSGDKADCDIDGAAQAWGAVSVSPAECLGERCSMSASCLAARAQSAACTADVVVTNHAYLAVQAALGAELFVGGTPKFGPFDHIVVDEAHELAPAVRSFASAKISGPSVAAVARAVANVARASERAKVGHEGQAVADRLGTELAALGRSGQAKELSCHDALKVCGPALAWARRAKAAVDKPWQMPGADRQIAASRALARLADLVANLSLASDDDDDVARWVEANDAKATLCVSPIMVAGLMARNLWAASDASVVLVSATLGANTAFETGLGNVGVVKYASPFTEAYRSCTLYVPSMPDALVGPDGRFDLASHRAWAMGQVRALVQANDGAALVLAATTASAQAYASDLRNERYGHEVLLAGEGPTEALVARWRSERSAVLVGTRGLMQGVDAPGDTCSLVIVDRVPRAAPNPVDDARVNAICKATGCDRWAADSSVYVADAALLLQQAAGRLVRSEADSGCLAVLDPRLHPGRLAYRGGAKAAYGAALSQFPPPVSSLAEAIRSIEQRKDNDNAHRDRTGNGQPSFFAPCMAP